MPAIQQPQLNIAGDLLGTNQAAIKFGVIYAREHMNGERALTLKPAFFIILKVASCRLPFGNPKTSAISDIRFPLKDLFR